MEQNTGAASSSFVSVAGLTVRDIRFPTRITKDGSDSINDADYSCAYVTITTDTGLKGYGLTFTAGRGTEIVCAAVRAYRHAVLGRNLDDIYKNFGGFWRELVHDQQLRWLGPEKGVTHLALAAIINALWDLWARLEGKPLWKLLVDMEPNKLLSVIDFRYITDALTKDEALEILMKGQEGKKEREEAIKKTGFPAYTTSAGWLGYSDEKVERLCKEALAEGFTRFKVKVGLDRTDDDRRVGLVRKLIGDDKMLMVDANQVWSVSEAIDWMIPLAKYNLTWIEEPTSPDDVLGHAKISAGLSKYSIGVATGENCCNRVVFKQLLQANAIQFCQIDSCRMAGPNEILSVYLMAAKFGVPVCPHAGGVGLCELVQHLSIFDYICISKTFDKRVIEYVDHLHSHFNDPVVIRDGCYQVPQQPGYSAEMKLDSLDAFEYPVGSVWQKLFADGTLYKWPDEDDSK